MKNKKFLVIAIIIIIIGAIGYGVFKVYSSYLFNKDGTIVDGHKLLIERIQKIENEEDRREIIEECLERNFITQEDANGLY